MDTEDKLILEAYTWDAYNFTPALFKPQVEACLLTQVVVRSKDDHINRDYSQLQKCSDLLAADNQLRQLLLDCWKAGSFGRIRRSAKLRNVAAPVPNDHSVTTSTVIHHGSTFTEVRGDMYSINYYKTATDRRTQEWFCDFDYRALQKDLYATRSEGTGEWFFESEALKVWLSTESKRIFWCPGMPGVGKTVISSMLVRYLEELRRGPTCFIYFSYKRRSKQSLSHILAAILRQLYEGFRPVSKILEGFYAFHSIHSHPTLSDFAGVFKTVSQKAEVIYLVVDGLDEYLEYYSDDAIITLRETLMAIPNLKLMVTSRVVGGMRQIFNTDDVVQQEIFTSASDIERYLNSRISAEIPSTIRYDIQGKILERVTQAAKQRFLLAKLHMDLITTRLTIGEIRETLVTLSEEIDYVYEQAVQRIDQQGRRQRELAYMVLMWVTCARRNLTVRELQHALAAAPGHENISDYLYSEELLTSICAGLIVVNQAVGLVHFVHYTAQEFFERARKTYFPDADLKMARSCLDYLLIDPREYEGPSRAWIVIDRLALLKYMMDYLGFHLNQCGDKITSIPDEIRANGLRLLIGACCGRGGHFSLREWSYLEWTPAHFAATIGSVSLLDRLISQTEDWNFREPTTGFTPLACAVRMGAQTVVQYLLDRDEGHVCETIENGDSMLSLAARHGYTDIVDILLAKSEVDVNAQNEIGRTALHSSAMYDQIAVFHQLISKPEVDVNAVDQAKETPLFLAVRYRHVTITKALLKDPRVVYNHINIRGLTPLAVAIAEASTPMIDILLERDSLAMSFRDKSGRSHLSWAADNGMLDLTKTILSFPDCPVDEPDNDGRTPLSYAASNGHQGVVDILLRTGQVDPDSKDSDGFTPLYFATKDGWTDIAFALLATKRVDADSVTTDGRTPLSVAAEFGQTSITKRLIQEDVEINSRDKYGRTPFSYAATHSHVSVMQMLLDKGALLDEEDAQGQTPLSHAAATWQHGFRGMELLIKAGGDVNSVDKQGFTPLIWSILNGYSPTVTFLLAHGANANHRDSEGRSPIWHAAKRLYDGEGVNELLEHTPGNMNSGDSTGRTPLIVAAEYAHYTNVGILVNAGAITDAKDLHGRTALHHAAGHGPDCDEMWRSSWGYHCVAEVLLQAGAGINVEDNEGRTPLDYAQDDEMISLLKKHGGICRNSEADLCGS